MEYNTLLHVDMEFLFKCSAWYHKWAQQTNEISSWEGDAFFWWFSEDFRRFSNICPKARQSFQAFSENSRRLPKFSEDNQRFLGKIQRCFNHRGIHLRKFFKGLPSICHQSNGGLFTSKNNMLFLCVKISCLCTKAHLVFTGVYIIKSVILQYYVHVYVTVKI